MAFTRFHDDPCRIIKQNQQSTDLGRRMLDNPGNGDEPSFMLDPQIIPQKWGANLWSNCIDVQSNLLGIDKRLTRGDCSKTVNVKDSRQIQYSYVSGFGTEQSRAIMPAWTARELEQVDRYYLPTNPQLHAMIQFNHNESTRILEKKNFVRRFDCQPNDNSQLNIIST